MSEPLFECPCCKRKGFTKRGLTAHYCRRRAIIAGDWRGGKMKLTPEQIERAREVAR